MPKRLLLLLAHPDDETFGPGGTIAACADTGVEVFLATATRGEAGMLGEPPLTDRAHVGAVRTSELRRAAKVLGIREVFFLGFVDGQLASVPRDRIVEEAVRQVRRFRPHVMIGFGPEGVSGHPDHKVMCEVALEAFDAAADPGRFPSRGAGDPGPWAPVKLYQFEIAQEILDAWEVPLRGVPRASLTTAVDTSAYVDRKIEAFRCHRTQARDADRILSREGYREFACQETFVLARSRVGAAFPPETDLFAGIAPVEFGKP